MNNVSKQSTSVSLVFIFKGLLFGAWASRIPFVQESFAFSEMELSALLLLLAAGAISSFPIAGKVADSIGPNKLSFWTCLFYPFAFSFIGFSESTLLLAIALFLFGWVHGAMDVAMNAWGAEVEKLKSRTLMPFYHAMFSLGAGVGAATGVIAATFSIEVLIHFLVVSLVIVPVAVYIWLNNDLNTPVISGDKSEKKSSFTFPTGQLLIVAIVAFSCALGEGAMADWASIYMSNEINSSHAQAAFAYTLFSVFMVITRLCGHRIIELLGVVSTIRVCALSSMFGATLLVLFSNTYISYLGFSLLGVGYAILMPLAFSKAAKVNDKNAGQAIAGVAIFAYGGMLLGPVLIGTLSDFISLRGAFTTFIILSIYVFFASNYFDGKRGSA